MSFSTVLLVAWCVQAVDATYNVFVADLLPFDVDGTSTAPGVKGEITVFVTPDGLLGVGGVSGLTANLQATSGRRLQALQTTTAPTPQPVDCNETNGGCSMQFLSGNSCQGTASRSQPYHATDAKLTYRGTDFDGVANFSFEVPPVDFGLPSSNVCPQGSLAITDAATCEAFSGANGLEYKGSASYQEDPIGCYKLGEGNDDYSQTYFNTHPIGDGNSGYVRVCKVLQEIEGKAFVVNNGDGDRVLCGTFRRQTSVKSATLAALDDYKVTGEVTLFMAGDKIIGAGRAMELESSLDDSSTAGNARGVHLLNGTSCASGEQGGNYFATSADPWANIGYTSTSSKGGASFVFSVPTSALEIEHRPFIVHNSAGGRVACGLIGAAYPVHTAELTRELIVAGSPSGVLGNVTVFVTPSGLMGTVTATGPQPSYKLRILDGSSCTGEAQQGVLYASDDTWTDITFPTTTSRRLSDPIIQESTFGFSVTTLAKDIKSKPVVVHDIDDNRVACGMLGGEPVTSTAVANLRELGNSKVEGKVTVYTTASKITGAGEATGLTANLASTNCAATDGCGAHVHSGASCTSVEQGGHFGMQMGVQDPWAKTGYTTTSSQGAANFIFSVSTTEVEVLGKPFIVHDTTGGPVSCGLLETPGAKEDDGASPPSSGLDWPWARTSGGRLAAVLNVLSCVSVFLSVV